MNTIDQSVQEVFEAIVNDYLDAYDVMYHPKDEAQTKASEILREMYTDVAIDHHLHEDDGFEKIIQIVVDRLADDYV